MRVSDKITEEEILSWQNGDIITISAGTDSGKSYFIKYKLYEFAKRNNKKILMLIHRTNCVNQFLDELMEDDATKLDWIDIKTYQFIEASIKKGEPIDFDEYSYIVSDEFHYFMGDASFNSYTDLSLEQILNAQNQVKIFMSATGDYMKSYIKKYREYETIDYSIPVDFSFIKHLEFYYQEATMHENIRTAIENKEKVLFFIRSAKKAYEYYEMYKEHSMFNCSESNDEYYKYVDKDKVNKMLKNEKFDDLILFTTTCMDAGVNIRDKSLRHIVLDIGLDISQIIQCIGRKRYDKANGDDYVRVYIKAIGNQQLGGNETYLKKLLDKARYFRRYGSKKYIEKYQREYDESKTVYNHIDEDGNVTLRLNELAYFGVKSQALEIKKAKEMGDWAFSRYVAKKLKVKNYSIAEDEKKMSELEIYLESIANKKLYKEEQEKLIEKIDMRDYRGRLYKTISTLNDCFEENGYSYRIVSKRDSKRKLPNGDTNPNYQKTYWYILK